MTVVYGIMYILHVLGAVLWVGGALFQAFVMGPVFRESGKDGTGFSLVLARRGGIGKYFAAAGAVTILFGLAMYGQNEAFRGHGFSSPQLYITLGAIVAVLAYLHGIFANFRVERQWIALCNGVGATPTPEQGAEMQRLGAKLGKNGVVSAALVAVALVLMLLRHVL